MPLSGREYMQSASLQSEITARVTIRWRTGILPTMRMVHDSQNYKIHAVLPDPTNRGWLNLMVSALSVASDEDLEIIIDGGTP